MCTAMQVSVGLVPAYMRLCRVTPVGMTRSTQHMIWHRIRCTVFPGGRCDFGPKSYPAQRLIVSHCYTCGSLVLYLSRHFAFAATAC